MKRFKEITLDNLGELKSIINAVKREANEMKGYAGKCVMLIGEETIGKAINKYHINGSEYLWERADEAVQLLGKPHASLIGYYVVSLVGFLGLVSLFLAGIIWHDDKKYK